MEMLMIQENSRYKNNEILNTGGFSKSPVFVLKIKRVFSVVVIAMIMLLFTAGCGDNKSPSVNGQDDKTGDMTEYVFGNDEPEPEDKNIFEGHNLSGYDSIFDISYVVENMRKESEGRKLLTYSMYDEKTLLFIWRDRPGSFSAETVGIENGIKEIICKWTKGDERDDETAFCILSPKPLLIKDDLNEIIYRPEDNVPLRYHEKVAGSWPVAINGEIYLYGGNTLYKVMGDDSVRMIYSLPLGYNYDLLDFSYPENCVTFGRTFGDVEIIRSFNLDNYTDASYIVEDFDVYEFLYTGDVGCKYYVDENEQTASVEIVYKNDDLKKTVNFNMTDDAYYMSVDSFPAVKDYAVAKLYEVMGDGQKYILINMNSYDPEKYEIPKFSELKSGEEGIQATHDMVNNIFEKYGVNVFYGYDIPDVGAYEISPMEDQEAIYTALLQLDEVMSEYPGDFYKTLTDGSFYSFMYVCFTGGMSGEDHEGSIENAGGLTSEVENGVCVYFDITDGLQKNSFVHEMIHVTDNVLIGEGYLSDSEWDKLNPDGFSYYYAYVSPEGNEYNDANPDYIEYTSLGTFTGEPNDPENIYFYSAYGKTYETEDRATIYEYLYVDYKSNFIEDYAYKSPHLREKIRFYNEKVRECFGENWGDNVLWEKALREVETY